VRGAPTLSAAAVVIVSFSFGSLLCPSLEQQVAAVGGWVSPAHTVRLFLLSNSG
jgi:hypothetical protein